MKRQRLFPWRILILAIGLASTFSCSASNTSTADGSLDGGASPDSGNSVHCQTPEVVASAQAAPSLVAADDQGVYWSNDLSHEIFYLPNGSTQPVLLTTEPELVSDLRTGDDGLYWLVGGSPRQLRSVPRTGGTPRVVAEVSQSARTLALDPSWAYWLDTPAGEISRTLRDGTGQPTLIVGGLQSAVSFAVDDQAVYYSSTADGTVRTVRLQDGSTSILASAQEEPEFVQVDVDYVYWAAGLDVMRIDKTGGSPQHLATVPAGTWDNVFDGIALDDTHVYLTLSNTGNVVRVPKLGGPAETIATGQASPYGIAVNDTGVYWANNDNGTVMRCPFP
ncbi:MAG: hypothetical protein ABI333_18965 [bacterium]